MATMNSEVSKKNRFWLPKERQKELEWHVRQYYYWKQTVEDITSYVKSNGEERVFSSNVSDPVARAAIEREWYKTRICFVDLANSDVCIGPYNYLFAVFREAVTLGYSYDILRARYPDLGINRRDFYELRRQFFWRLDQYMKGLVHEME